jgi:GH24 family phage-related lysozyme (muramidase)
MEGTMVEQEESPWEGQCADAAYDFALRCARLATQNPYQQDTATSLRYIIGTLMTELWDRNFSQGEIKQAFEEAIAAMPRYAAGEERPSELATSDWRPHKGAQ